MRRAAGRGSSRRAADRPRFFEGVASDGSKFRRLLNPRR